MSDKITVQADSNESGSRRMADLANALEGDSRFDWGGYTSLDVDLQFNIEIKSSKYPISLMQYFNVELKEPADYVASALGPTGHLADQILTMREAGHPCMVLVLGGDEEVQAACLDALKTRYKGQNLAFQIGSYSDRLIDFESNSEALGCPVRRWKSRPWKRLLSLAHKVLSGGDLYGYRPRPAQGERELVAAATMFKGMGPELMKKVLTDYQLCFAPRNGYARPIEEIPGIGKKRAAMINPHVRMIYLNRVLA